MYGSRGGVFVGGGAGRGGGGGGPGGPSPSPWMEQGGERERDIRQPSPSPAPPVPSRESERKQCPLPPGALPHWRLGIIIALRVLSCSVVFLRCCGQCSAELFVIRWITREEEEEETFGDNSSFPPTGEGCS